MRGAASIGVLALQGDFAAHARALERSGVTAVEVRRPAQLPGLDGLIMPGGESTALLRLMEPEGWEEALRAFHRGGGALFGTCAGLILLAREVTAPTQRSLGLLDCAVERNAYGRQIDSFVGTGTLTLDGEESDAEMVFIRAPRIREVGPGIEVVARHAGEPVAIRSGRLLGATFHPELTAESALHGYFVRIASGRAAGATASTQAT